MSLWPMKVPTTKTSNECRLSPNRSPKSTFTTGRWGWMVGHKNTYLALPIHTLLRLPNHCATQTASLVPHGNCLCRTRSGPTFSWWQNSLVTVSENSKGIKSKAFKNQNSQCLILKHVNKMVNLVMGLFVNYYYLWLVIKADTDEMHFIIHTYLHTKIVWQSQKRTNITKRPYQNSCIHKCMR